MQEAGEIVGAVRHQLAAADADEQIEEFALDAVCVGIAGRVGESDMGDAQRRRIAAQLGQTAQQLRVRRSRQQRRQQRVFLRAREIDFVDVVGHLLSAVKIGPQDRARDTGHGFDREHALGGNARPI